MGSKVVNNRKPEQFDGQKVLILGGGASGTDIAVEVAGKASKVAFLPVNFSDDTKLATEAFVEECLDF